MGSCCFVHTKKSHQASPQIHSTIKCPINTFKNQGDVLTLNDNNNQLQTNIFPIKNEIPQTIQECSKEEDFPNEQKVESIIIKNLPETAVNDNKDYENLRIGNREEDTISKNILFGYYDLITGIRKQTEDDVIIQMFNNLSDKEKELIQREKQSIYELKHRNMLDIIPLNNISNLISYESFRFGLNCMTLDKKTKNEPVKEREIKVYLESLVKFMEAMHKKNIFPVYVRINSTFVNPTNEIKVPNCKVNSLLLKNAQYFYEKISIDENDDHLDCYLPLFFIKDSKKREFNKAFDLWSLGCYLFQLRTGVEPWKHPTDKSDNSFYNMKTFVEFIKNVKEDNPMKYYINKGGKVKFDSAFSDFLDLLFDPQKQKANIYIQLEGTDFWTKYYPESSSADSSESNFKHNLNENERVNNMLEGLGVFSIPVSEHNNEQINNNQLEKQKEDSVKHSGSKNSQEVIIVSEPHDKCPGITITTHQRIFQMNGRLGEKETKETNEKEKETFSDKDRLKFDSSFNDENSNNLSPNTNKHNLNESNGIQIVDMGIESNHHCLNEVYNDNSDDDGCFVRNNK